MIFDAVEPAREIAHDATLPLKSDTAWRNIAPTARFLLCAVFLLAAYRLEAKVPSRDSTSGATYYMSPSGNDKNPGTRIRLLES
jgi:hypothetical protein